jgi:hypothetical protein
MTSALDDDVLSRWRADPAAFIEKYLINPETNKASPRAPTPRPARPAADSASSAGPTCTSEVRGMFSL